MNDTSEDTSENVVDEDLLSSWSFVLPEDRIARFYAHRFTFTDAARIVIGWPPSGLAPVRFARSFVSLPDPVAT